jgi:hypothetical protein
VMPEDDEGVEELELVIVTGWRLSR